MTKKHTGRINLKPLIHEDDAFVDIPTMRASPIDGYLNYIENEVFFVDHHDVLRAGFGEFPIATTPEQVDSLIGYLEKVKTRMIASNE